MVEEVGTEQRLARFLEQHARVPPVRQMRRTMEAIAVFAYGEDIVRRHAARRADGEVVHRD
jgi:hypothetical protein